VSRFPRDLPRGRVLRALRSLGFEVVRTGTHISMARANGDGTTTPLTMPNHPHIKSWTLLEMCRQSGIDRDELLEALAKRR
jgi:predicted RNA binding protein YcfA (HicA-like mRNA interferase family)